VQVVPENPVSPSPPAGGFFIAIGPYPRATSNEERGTNLNRDEKAAAVEEIAGQIEAAESIFAIDYRGISVPQAAELRAKLREADASFRVVKNRLTKLAAEKAGREQLTELLDGPTALTFVRGDMALAAKAIMTLDRQWEVLEFKGGLVDGEVLDAEEFKVISRLPGRDALNAQLAGVVASPLTGLVRGLSSMISGLASQLQQIADQGLISGEAPAEAEPEAPAEEAAPAQPAQEAPADEEAPPEEAPAEEAPAEEAPPEEETSDESEESK
jgi:large subunit ribosomal protein L10